MKATSLEEIDSGSAKSSFEGGAQMLRRLPRHIPQPLQPQLGTEDALPRLATGIGLPRWLFFHLQSSQPVTLLHGSMPLQLTDASVAFIGGGNMAGAIIGGLLSKGIAKEKIIVSEPWEVNRNKMKSLGVRTTESNVEATKDADIIILAVKPQVAKEVCEELGRASQPAPLVISIAAGITLESLEQWISQGGSKPHVIRVMPNTPALVGEGASGAYAGSEVTEDEKTLATALLHSVSKATEWVDKEELLDVVTGLSGMEISWAIVDR